MSCLHIKNLKVTFQTALGRVCAVDNVSLDHLDKETLALVGETGCGKSVIANSILRLLPGNADIEGQIFFRGEDLLKMSEKELSLIRGKEIGIVFQNPAMALNPVHSIGRQISEPFVVHGILKKKRSLSRAVSLLKRMRFEEAEENCKKFPFQFSGGMNQRVLIAISVALNPKVLIADEPTKALDMGLKEHVVEELEIIKQMNSSTLLLITHDLNLARKISDRIAIMYAGEIIEISPIEDFFSRQMHPYSQALLKSLPEQGFNPIPGSLPSMINPPPGCKFHPRCPLVREQCKSMKPPFITLEGRGVKCLLYT